MAKTYFLALSLAILASVITTVHAGPYEITLENIDEYISEKNVFIKFYAPWCGHCKSMKPDWDKLADDYVGSPTVVIGEVDCTEDGVELCELYDVKSYPTLKYFVDGDKKGQLYTGSNVPGGRSYEVFKDFVEENLQVRCNIHNVITNNGDNPEEFCSEKELNYMEKMKSKSSADRRQQIQRLEKMAGESMTVDLKRWLKQRLNILRALETSI